MITFIIIRMRVAENGTLHYMFPVEVGNYSRDVVTLAKRLVQISAATTNIFLFQINLHKVVNNASKISHIARWIVQMVQISVVTLIIFI